jgi:hypothetical protein
MSHWLTIGLTQLTSCFSAKMSRKPSPFIIAPVLVAVLTTGNSYSRTACVLTGSPTPTIGSCELTWTGHIRTWTQSSQITFQLPETEPLFLGICPATLEVVGSGTAAPTTTTAPPKATSGTGATASATPTATTTQSTMQLSERLYLCCSSLEEGQLL